MFMRTTCGYYVHVHLHIIHVRKALNPPSSGTHSRSFFPQMSFIKLYMYIDNIKQLILRNPLAPSPLALISNLSPPIRRHF